MRKSTLKTIPFFLSAMTIIVTVYFYLHFGHGQYKLGGDSLGYYIYLPTTFIYQNLTQMDSSPDPSYPEVYKNYVNNPPYNNPKTPLGKHIVQYTFGVALMEAPFFLASHALAGFLEMPKDGFSNPYQYGILISNWFYVLAGIVLLYLSLKRYFSSEVSLTTCSLLILGTNIFYFIIFQFGM